MRVYHYSNCCMILQENTIFVGTINYPTKMLVCAPTIGEVLSLMNFLHGPQPPMNYSFAVIQYCIILLIVYKFLSIVEPVVSRKRAHGRCTLYYIRTSEASILCTTKRANQCKQCMTSWAKHLVL